MASRILKHIQYCLKRTALLPYPKIREKRIPQILNYEKALFIFPNWKYWCVWRPSLITENYRPDQQGTVLSEDLIFWSWYRDRSILYNVMHNKKQSNLPYTRFNLVVHSWSMTGYFVIRVLKSICAWQMFWETSHLCFFGICFLGSESPLCLQSHISHLILRGREKHKSVARIWVMHQVFTEQVYNCAVMKSTAMTI